MKENYFHRLVGYYRDLSGLRENQRPTRAISMSRAIRPMTSAEIMIGPAMSATSQNPPTMMV